MFAKGLHSWQYTIYNFDQLHFYENNQKFLDPIILINNKLWVINQFSRLFKYFLQVPILYIASNILIKSAIIYILYLITAKLINEKKISFVIILFFTASSGYAAHGVVLNGMFEAPIFFRSSVSALMTLLGLYLMLANRHLLAIIPFALSTNLHPGYGVTSFAFIFSSFFFYYLIKSKVSLKIFLTMSLLVLLSILPLVFHSGSASLETVESSIENWYKYLFATNPDDLSLLWYLGVSGYFVVPFLMVSVYFVFTNREKKILDYIFLGSFGLFILIFFIEILHFNRVFFEGLSEKFLAVQFRRGIWILMLFGAIINFLNIFNKIIENNDKIVFYFIAFGYVYLFPNFFSLIATLAIASLHLKQVKILYLLLSSIFVAYIGYVLGFFQISDSQYKVLLLLAFLTATKSFLYYYKLLNKNNIFIFMIISFMASISILGLTTNKHFQSDMKIITNNGFFSAPDLLELEKKVYGSQGKVINPKIINYIRNNNPENKLVQEAAGNLSYGDSIIYNSPTFISKRDLVMPLFGKLFYEHLLYKLNLININKLNVLNSQKKMLNLIEEQVNNLNKHELAKLFKTHNVRFLITNKSFDFIKPIVIENNYFLYDLTNLPAIDK